MNFTQGSGGNSTSAGDDDDWPTFNSTMLPLFNATLNATDGEESAGSDSGWAFLLEQVGTWQFWLLAAALAVLLACATALAACIAYKATCGNRSRKAAKAKAKAIAPASADPVAGRAQQSEMRSALRKAGGSLLKVARVFGKHGKRANAEADAAAAEKPATIPEEKPTDDDDGKPAADNREGANDRDRSDGADVRRDQFRLPPLKLRGVPYVHIPRDERRPLPDFCQLP